MATEGTAELVTLLQAPTVSLEDRNAAFGELVTRYQDMAYGYAYARLGVRQLAQDAAQEAFVAAYQHLGELREPGAFAAWLRRIVLSQCNRIARTREGHALPLGELETDSAEPGPAALSERQALQRRVIAAVQALPEHERAAMVLYYIDGYSQDQVADFLEVPTPTVRKRLQRGRDKLRETMIDLLKDGLAEGRPSNDGGFVQRVQLVTSLEAAGPDAEITVLEALLVEGVDANALIEGDQPLLHWAAARGHEEAVQMLLRHGANPALRDRFGRTALRLAIDNGHHEVAELLRRHGAPA